MDSIKGPSEGYEITRLIKLPRTGEKNERSD